MHRNEDKGDTRTVWKVDRHRGAVVYQEHRDLTVAFI